jgi:hypothetical protein
MKVASAALENRIGSASDARDRVDITANRRG